MRHVYNSTILVIAISILVPSTVFGDGAQTLSITNYRLISQQPATQTLASKTYVADLVNSGPALASVVATVTSLDPFSVRVVPGQGTLNFAPVPANSQVTSNNSFTILADPNAALDPSKLQWTFQATAAGLTANAGPNQTVNVGSLVTLDGSGSSNPGGIGTLQYLWKFTSRPPGSGTILFNNTNVMPSFVVDVAGTYVLTLTVTNGVSSSSANVTVSTKNSPPVANAGPNQTVAVGSTVQLDGSKSSDVDGDTLTYKWTLTKVPAGSNAALTGSTTSSPTFVADKFGTYMAQLIVNDGFTDSPPASITITTSNTAPVANAGAGQVITVGKTVQLDGSGSTDIDGDPLTYKWTLPTVPAGSKAMLNNPNIVNPTFIADVAGTYVAQLIVNDGMSDSAPSTVMITTSATMPPTANAGPNQSIAQNVLVTLAGGGTDPQNLPLTFKWSLIQKPAGSTAALSSTTAMNPTFIADLPGTYVAQLIVNNGFLDSAPSTVTITSTAPTRPVANAGPNQSVPVGATVKLDGSSSSDVNNNPLFYSWSLLTAPPGSTATLTGASTVAPTFVADVNGTYVAQLIVSDGSLNSDPATVTITTQSLMLTPNPLNLAGVSGTLTVTLSSPAGMGGVVVHLASLTPSVASVPATVTVLEGAPSADVPVTPGNTLGKTLILATATGFSNATATVNLTQLGGGGGPPTATISFSPTMLSITGTATQNLTLNISPKAPAGGQVINLSSGNMGIATVPATVTFVAGATSVNVPVTGVAAGSTMIHASALPNIADTAASVTVMSVPVSGIQLPANVSLEPSQTVPFPVMLVMAAPPGGVFISLSSSDTNILTVSPANIFIPEGATSPNSPPKISGVSLGTATVMASASGLLPASQSVKVTATLGFSPTSVSIGPGSLRTIVLTLSSPAPPGLTVNLSSDNIGVATVPSSVTFTAGSTSANVLVNGIGSGSTLIHASSLPLLGDTTASVTVP